MRNDPRLLRVEIEYAPYSEERRERALDALAEMIDRICEERRGGGPGGLQIGRTGPMEEETA